MKNLHFIKPARNLIVLCIISVFPAMAQNNPDSIYQANLRQKVGEIPQVSAQMKSVGMPSAPHGFELTLAGSDNPNVVEQTGIIHTPLVPTTVTLYYNLTGGNLSEPLEIGNKQVIIPGKYLDEGKNSKPEVIPSLREWHGYDGQFELTKRTAIVVNPSYKKQLQKAAEIFQNDLKLLTGVMCPIKTGKPASGDLYLTLQDKDTGLGEEGYYLTIEDRITISASQYKGLFLGTRTVLQILEQNASHKYIPKGVARDYPKYNIRGLILDVGRKFFTMGFLRDYVKFMSYYKMTNFQIHLNDNGFKQYFNNNWDSTYTAFRLESETYPALTAKDGSYSKKEFIELQKLADEYAVAIIPEIDVPAHSLSFGHAFPEIGSAKYGMDHLDLHNPLTYEVVENVFKEYLDGPNPVFTGKGVHIGTDEYDKREAEKFRAFTDHFIRYVQGFGKNVWIWGALTHAKGETPVTSENVTMNAWYNGYADPKEMKKQGYKLVSTPDGYLYIVPAAGYYYDYLNLKMLFNKWEPIHIGNVAFAPGDPAVIGGMFAVWNDIVGNGITMKDVNDRVFPAMQVLAQKMWAGAEKDLSFDSFTTIGKRVGEGPGLNIRGKLPADAKNLVAYYDFEKTQQTGKNATYSKGHKGNALWLNGGESYLSLPFVEAGYDYTVAFWVNLLEDTPGSILFSSPNASVKIMNNGKLGFVRENYSDDFDYSLPVNKWTHIAIVGTNKGTELYVNGISQKRLYDNEISYTGTDKKTRKVETLFFPLEKIGDATHSFKGGIDELFIFNTALDQQSIGMNKDRQ